MVRALELARDLGLSSIIIEGDSLAVINSFNCEKSSLSNLGLIIEEAKLLGRQFARCQATHTRIQGNNVAHRLAQRGMGLNEDVIWVEEVPHDIIGFVSADTPCNLTSISYDVNLFLLF